MLYRFNVVHFFQILYADSLAVPNVQIPDTSPRIAAWKRNLLDEVIKLDTNRDGSFGKLKVFLFLGNLEHLCAWPFLSITQTTIFQSLLIPSATFFFSSSNHRHIQWCRTLLSTWMTYIALYHQKRLEIWHKMYVHFLLPLYICPSSLVFFLSKLFSFPV